MDFVREVLKLFSCNAKTSKLVWNEWSKKQFQFDFQNFWAFLESEGVKIFLGDFAGFNIADCIKLPEI